MCVNVFGTAPYFPNTNTKSTSKKAPAVGDINYLVRFVIITVCSYKVLLLPSQSINLLHQSNLFHCCCPHRSHIATDEQIISFYI